MNSECDSISSENIHVPIYQFLAIQVFGLMQFNHSFSLWLFQKKGHSLRQLKFNQLTQTRFTDFPRNFRRNHMHFFFGTLIISVLLFCFYTFLSIFFLIIDASSISLMLNHSKRFCRHSFVNKRCIYETCKWDIGI